MAQDSWWQFIDRALLPKLPLIRIQKSGFVREIVNFSSI